MDLFKNNNPVEKISTATKAIKQESKSVYFNDEVKLKCDTDSLKNAVIPNLCKKQETHL